MKLRRRPSRRCPGQQKRAPAASLFSGLGVLLRAAAFFAPWLRRRRVQIAARSDNERARLYTGSTRCLLRLGLAFFNSWSRGLFGAKRC